MRLAGLPVEPVDKYNMVAGTACRNSQENVSLMGKGSIEEGTRLSLQLLPVATAASGVRSQYSTNALYFF
jgi:hypothetical protein